jgi:radical SAM protein with 4Fe4S-binding SPASM domain
MNSKQKLIALHEFKAKMFECPDYFTLEDRRDIENTKDEVLEKIWNSMKDSIYIHRNIRSIDSDESCFWCVLSKTCRTCNYAERHGECNSDESDNMWYDICTLYDDQSVAEKILELENQK